MKYSNSYAMTFDVSCMNIRFIGIINALSANIIVTLYIWIYVADVTYVVVPLYVRGRLYLYVRDVCVHLHLCPCVHKLTRDKSKWVSCAIELSWWAHFSTTFMNMSHREHPTIIRLSGLSIIRNVVTWLIVSATKCRKTGGALSVWLMHRLRPISSSLTKPASATKKLTWWHIHCVD